MDNKKIKNQTFLIALAIVFALIGMPTFLYAEEVDVSALVPTEAPPPGGGPIFVPDTTPPEIFDIVVESTTSDSAVISWKTSEPSIPQINYGKTKDYKKTIIGKDFLMSHRIILENLLADTIYHFEIVAADRAGNRTSSGNYTFKTMPGPDTLAPANISNFEAIAGNGQITLKWQNPADPDFKAVRIMRGEGFYPQDPEQGKLVYDDKETSFVDTGLINGKRYYYTAFAYDFSGNFSSTNVRYATSDENGATSEPVAQNPTYVTISTNAPNGVIISARSEGDSSDAGIYKSSSPTKLITAAACATVDNGVESYALYVKNVGSNLTAASGFNGETCAGTISTIGQTILTASVPLVTNNTADVALKAATAGVTAAGSYSDVITLTATGKF